MNPQEQRVRDLVQMGIPNDIIVKRLMQEYKISEKDAIITVDRVQGYSWD
jgi:CTP synthase (UTP-ammonia lyase)